jgi:hypothetical protein
LNLLIISIERKGEDVEGCLNRISKVIVLKCSTVENPTGFDIRKVASLKKFVSLII